MVHEIGSSLYLGVLFMIDVEASALHVVVY